MDTQIENAIQNARGNFFEAKGICNEFSVNPEMG